MHRVNDTTLLEIWRPLIQAVVNATDMPWVVTSVIRDSPSHKRGRAIDIAPRPNGQRIGAGQDNPFLNFSDLKDRLSRAASTIESSGRTILANYGAFGLDVRTVGLFIEDDHIHAQVFQACTFVKRHLANSRKNYNNRGDYSHRLAVLTSLS